MVLEQNMSTLNNVMGGGKNRARTLILVDTQGKLPEDDATKNHVAFTIKKKTEEAKH